MKCKIKAGDLRDALQTASITVDRRPGSDLGYVYLGAKRTKSGGSQRIVFNSTDGIGRFLVKRACEVEEGGDLYIEPVRLSSLLDKRADTEVVTFNTDAGSGRTMVRCGSARVTLGSASGKAAIFAANMETFPHALPPSFKIEAANLKALLDHTQPFIFRRDGQEFMKTIALRTAVGGYEATTTNGECVAKAFIADVLSPGLTDDKPVKLVEIPARALPALSKLLSRNKKENVEVIIGMTDGKPVAVFFRTLLAFFGTSLLASTQLPVDIVFTVQKTDTTVTVARQDVLDSLGRCSPFCSESDAGRLVSVEVNDGLVRLTASDQFGDFEERFVPSAIDGTGSPDDITARLEGALANVPSGA